MIYTLNVRFKKQFRTYLNFLVFGVDVIIIILLIYSLYIYYGWKVSKNDPNNNSNIKS